MTDSSHERLIEVKEQKFRLEKSERKREDLQRRLREQERIIVQLEVQVELEQADVDELTRMSLSNLFHTILRSKEEQLELERQQALAAALKLQEAKQTQENIKNELVQVGEELFNLQSAERDYQRLMADRESALRNSPIASAELAEIESQIADQTIQVKEIYEAWTAGKRVIASLENASSSLEKAENWGKWDLWGGGGMISTHMKHNHVDDAKNFIHNANYLMQNFRSELDDLKRNVDIEIDISDMLKVADYWFDGLITDWVVQGRIKNAQDQTQKAIQQVRAVTNQLQSEHSTAESSLRGLKTKHVAWIEGRSLND
ncbi:MAG: hypothetical protein ACQEXQ_29505 [Bacillota bacterium]